MLIGRQGAVMFRSKYGGGEWVFAASQANPQVGQEYAIEIPKNLATDIGNRKAKGLVPAIGIRVRGTLASDMRAAPNEAQTEELYCTKLQRGSFVNLFIQNSYKNPYSSVPLDLAKWMIFSEIVNPDAEMLDQEFSGRRGIVPSSMISPIDINPGNDPVTMNRAVNDMRENPYNYTTESRLDSMWRELEGLAPIRGQTGLARITTTTDDLFSIPLCATTGNRRANSIPLETLCDMNQPWQAQVTINRNPTGTLVGIGGDGGSFTITAIELWLYVIPLRQRDAREYGTPYYIKSMVRAQSPLLYDKGQTILYSGNIPDTKSTLVDTITDKDAVTRSYRHIIAYGDYSGDLANGLTLDWYSAGECYFPWYFKDRSPRHVYDGVHNKRTGHHLIRYGFQADGATPQIVVRSGRDQNAVLGYQNIIDANIANVLGCVSPWPVRIVAETALEMDGFPGFGTLDNNCQAPYIELEGWVPSSAMYDVILNSSKEDQQYIATLGNNCCNGELPKFAPTIDKSTATTGIITNAELTPKKEIKLTDPAAANVPSVDPTLSSVGQNPAGRPTGSLTQA